MKAGWLKKEAEGLLLTAQDQALPTRNYKVMIMNEKGSKMCWMCGARDETVMHILSECEKLAQGEYKKRPDRVASFIHWELTCVLFIDSRGAKTGLTIELSQ